MTTKKHLVLVAALLIPVGCSSSSSDSSAPPAADAATPDSASPDASSDDSSDTGTTPAYPAGPYGVGVGDTLDPTLQWQAYAPNSSTVSTLSITDLYDPDGSKGINAVVFDSSAQWCVACQYEAGNVPSWLSSTGPNSGNWTALGVQFVTLVIQTNSYEPATIETAEQWRTLYNLPDIYVAADPGVTFPTPSLPHNVLVNPRTMKVTVDLDNDVYDAAGSDPAGTGEAPDPAVAKLATHNQTN